MVDAGIIPIARRHAPRCRCSNTFPEIDGVVRRVPPHIGDNTYLPWQWKLYELLLALPSSRLRLTQGGIEAIRVPVIPLLERIPNGINRLRWNKEFKTVRVAEDDFSILAAKTVIVGVTAEGFSGIIAANLKRPQYNYLARGNNSYKL